MLDASAATAWLLPSQTTAAASTLLDHLDQFALIAPAVFGWEIGNIIVRRAMRGGDFRLEEALEQVHSFQIEMQPPMTIEEVWAATSGALERGLSLFDVAYLDLALERGGALASRDRQLLAAARRLGLETFDLND
ncbi:MAG TPA: type II toxin-antitoxin system VapC family toxin [Phenylobacterium sp.]|nr:type II toxin-antitoxin system VapC family toxin [Phenylobacterium sp.]